MITPNDKINDNILNVIIFEGLDVMAFSSVEDVIIFHGVHVIIFEVLDVIILESLMLSF